MLRRRVGVAYGTLSARNEPQPWPDVANRIRESPADALLLDFDGMLAPSYGATLCGDRITPCNGLCLLS